MSYDSEDIREYRGIQIKICIYARIASKFFKGI